jgi:putative transposase
MDILALLHCLQPVLAHTPMRQLSHIIVAMLRMSGRVTMLGISRWTDPGGSYRTVQRFFYTKAIPWTMLFWLFFRQHVFRAEDYYLLAGDEVVVTKAGKATHGLDRFFAGLHQQLVPGLAFFTLAIISTTDRRAFPIRVEQVVRTDAEKIAGNAKQQAKQVKDALPKRTPGRPKGRLNKNKAEVPLTPELQRIKGWVQQQLQQIGGALPLLYLVLDGHFGTNPACQMVRQCELHLISKLRADAAVYFRYAGPYAGHGPRRKYGDKIDYRHLPDQYLKQVTLEKEVETRYYQAEMLHKEFGQPLNVVILVKTNLQTGAWAHVGLFCTDLSLAYDQLIDFYRLRFQIEFNFRDAKQFWGLEDFMNISATAVTNAANLSLFMVTLVEVVLRDFRKTNPQFGILDLKAYCRGARYVAETIKMLPEKPDANSLAAIFRKLATLGSIHAHEVPVTTA